jgi:hypothetical protein
MTLPFTLPDPLGPLSPRSPAPPSASVPDRRRERLARVLTWGAGLACAIGVAPTVFLVVQGAAGLAAAGVLGLTGIHLAPVLARKLAHTRLRLLRHEARTHPLVTLEQLLIERRTALAQAGLQLQTALAQIDGFVEQARAFAERHPDAAPRWQARAERAEQLRAQKKQALRRAAESVAAFEQEVGRARTEWALVEAEQALRRSLDATQGDPLLQLLQRTALDQVRLRMNEAFASLETELLLDLDLEAPPTPAVPRQPGSRP